MDRSEQAALRAGTHWLNRLAAERGIDDSAKFISEMEAWEWEPGEIALAIMDSTQPNGVTMECKIHLRVWPIEKKMILDAAKGSKLNEFIRAAVIEKAISSR